MAVYGVLTIDNRIILTLCFTLQRLPTAKFQRNSLYPWRETALQPQPQLAGARFHGNAERRCRTITFSKLLLVTISSTDETTYL